MTANQQRFLEILEMYAGIADNGNLMLETGWGRRKVAAVGRTLVRAGLVTYTPTDATGFEGGIYKLVKGGEDVG